MSITPATGDSEQDGGAPIDDEHADEAASDEIGTSDEIDEFAPEDFEDDPNDTRPRSTIKRVGTGGQMLGAAMLGLAEILEPKQKPRIAAIVDHPGEPLDLDRRGLDESFGEAGSRLKGPPLDDVKAKAHTGRRIKRRR